MESDSYRGFDAYLEYQMNLFRFQDRATMCLKPLIHTVSALWNIYTNFRSQTIFCYIS